MGLLHKKCATAALAAALFTFAALFAARAVRAAPLEVYGRLPSLEEVALSPDGTRIAFIRTTANDRLLVVLSVADRKVMGKLFRIGKVKLRSIEWADEDHLLIVSSVTSLPLGLSGRVSEWYMLSVFDVVKQKLTIYPEPDSSRQDRIMNVLSLSTRVMVRRLEGHTVLFVPGIYLTDVTLPALFRVDLSSGSQRLVRHGSLATEAWLVDETGEVAAEEEYDQQRQRWRMLERRDGRMQEIASGHEPIDTPDLLGFGPEPGTLLMQMTEDGDPVWRQLSLKDGTFGPSMTERDSLEEPIEDRLTYRMIGGVHVDDSAHYVFFDPKKQATWNKILSAFAQEQVRFVSASADFRKIVVRVQGQIHGYCYYLVDISTLKADPVGLVYDGMDARLCSARRCNARPWGLSLRCLRSRDLRPETHVAGGERGWRRKGAALLGPPDGGERSIRSGVGAQAPGTGLDLLDQAQAQARELTSACGI